MIKRYSLQRKIDSDEDYNTFLKHDGLLVIDVFKGVFGPCTGMVSTLRKLKEMDGYEDLHLAICKSDNIKALSRFRNSCKPTWLFIINGTEVEKMIGANSPKLEKLINKQLLLLPKKCSPIQEELNENSISETKIKTHNKMHQQSINNENKENMKDKTNELNKKKKPIDDDQPKYSILEFL